MTPYRNLSGIAAFTIDAQSIQVRFYSGDTPNYLYDYASTGAAHVEAMKSRARAGRGLSTYIAQHVREHYARRW